MTIGPRCVVLVAGLAVLAVTAGVGDATRAATATSERRVGAASDAELTVADRLVLTRRLVRETLLGAAVTPAEMSAVSDRLSGFVRSWVRGVRNGDEAIVGSSLDVYFDLKVRPSLDRLGLRAEEQAAVRELVATWVDLELSVAAESGDAALPSTARVR